MFEEITKRHFIQLAAFLGAAQYSKNFNSSERVSKMADEITKRGFDGIEFVQIRIDHNETQYDEIPRALAAEYGSGNADNLPLDPKLAELVRLLVSIRSRCAYCTILHSKEARDLGILPAKIDALPAWRETQVFTEAEMAALNYAEVISDENEREMQAAHDQLSGQMDAAQIEALLMVIVNMNVWTRIFLAQGRQAKLT